MSRFATISGVFCVLFLLLTIASAQRRSFQDAEQLSAEGDVGLAAGNQPLERSAPRTPAKTSRGMQGKFKRKLVLRNKEEQNEFAIEDGYTYSFGFGSGLERPRQARRPVHRTNADYDYHTSEGEGVVSGRGSAGNPAGGSAENVGRGGRRAHNRAGPSANSRERSDGRASVAATGSFQTRRTPEPATFPDYSDGSSSPGVDIRSAELNTAPRVARRLCAGNADKGCRRGRKEPGVPRPRSGITEGSSNQGRPGSRSGFGEVMPESDQPSRRTQDPARAPGTTETASLSSKVTSADQQGVTEPEQQPARKKKSRRSRKPKEITVDSGSNSTVIKTEATVIPPEAAEKTAEIPKVSEQTQIQIPKPVAAEQSEQAPVEQTTQKKKKRRSRSRSSSKPLETPAAEPSSNVESAGSSNASTTPGNNAPSTTPTEQKTAEVPAPVL